MEVTGKSEYLIQESGCGPFQMLVVFIVFASIKPPAAFTMMFMSFGNYNPGWRCLDNMTISDNHQTGSQIVFQNVTLPSTQTYNDDNVDLGSRSNLMIYDNDTQLEYTLGSCPDFEACKNVQFNPDISTIVTEWGLLCSKNWVTSLIISLQMVGLLVGSFFSGYSGDAIGRKKVLYIAVGINGLLQVIGAFLNSWQSFAAIQFFIGLDLAVIVAQHGTLAAEFLTTKWRGRLYPLPTWAIASVLLALLAMVCKDWRYMHAITACLSFLYCFTALWVPESLRWLEVKGRTDEFNKVAKKIISINKINVSVELSDSDTMFLNDRVKHNEEEMNKKYTLLDLFRKGYRLYSVLLGFIWMSASLIYFAISFGVKNLSGNFFINLIIMNVIELPLSILFVLAPNLIGRKKSCMLFLAITASCLMTTAIFEIWVSGGTRQVGTLILALLAKAMMSGAWDVVFIIMAEIYPTIVRSTATNYGTGMARFGGIVAPFLIPADAESLYICYIVMGVFVIVCCLALTMLPETRGKPLKETFADE